MNYCIPDTQTLDSFLTQTEDVIVSSILPTPKHHTDGLEEMSEAKEFIISVAKLLGIQVSRAFQQWRF